MRYLDGELESQKGHGNDAIYTEFHAHGSEHLEVASRQVQLPRRRAPRRRVRHGQRDVPPQQIDGVICLIGIILTASTWLLSASSHSPASTSEAMRCVPIALLFVVIRSLGARRPYLYSMLSIHMRTTRHRAAAPSGRCSRRTSSLPRMMTPRATTHSATAHCR